MTKIKYLGRRVTNQNDIHKEVESGLDSVNACYFSDQNLLSSRLLNNSVNIKTHKNTTVALGNHVYC